MILLTRPGDVTLLPPGTSHDYGVPSGKQWEFFWCHFLPRPSWVPWLGDWPPITSSEMLRLMAISSLLQPRIHSAFERLMVDTAVARQRSAIYSEELALNTLEEILLVCIREVARNTGTYLDPRVNHVLNLLAVDLTKDLRVTELATAVALSPSRLEHLFKQQTGRSVLETLTLMRLQQGARLLTYTPSAVEEIAYAVGFHSASYFSRRFRQCYGQSPSAYRTSIKIHQVT